MTPTILALDTSTETCSAALKIGNEVVTRSENVPREHTTKILPMVDELLSEAGISLEQLDLLAYGQGPGSFTGVRIGIGIAQGLAFGVDLPMVGISTLEAMAQQVFRLHGANQVLSAIDARMNEIYLGGFVRNSNGDWQTTVEEQVTAPEKINLAVEGDWFLAGTGWLAHPALIDDPKLMLKESSVLYPKAEDMISLAEYRYEKGDFVSAENARPVYIRDTVTWQKLAGRE